MDTLRRWQNHGRRWCGLALAAILLGLWANGGAGAKDRTAGTGRAATAPAVPDGLVFRPRFRMRDGEINAGTAFAVNVKGQARPVILTALHLFGPAGGYREQVPAEKLPEAGQGMTLRDAFVKGAAPIKLGASVLAIVGSAPFREPSAAGDVAAFWAPAGAALHPAPLAEKAPGRGEEVWLAAALVEGGRPGQRLHRAVVGGKSRFLAYVFDDKLELQATSGAPVLNARGEVVGIHVGGTERRGRTVGVATPVDAFRGPLLQACEKSPPPDGGKAK